MTKELALSSLKKSIVKVEPDYIWIDIFKSKYQQERCFAYEVYRKWNNLIDIYKIEGRIDKKIKVNGEVFKNLKGKYVSPDLVLHGGQDNFNQHYLACEIKRYEQTEILKILADLEKLVAYLNLSKQVKPEKVENVSDYEQVVELFMGGTIKLLKKRIKKVIEKNVSNKEEKLKILRKLSNLDVSQQERMILIFTKKINSCNEEGENKIEIEDISLRDLTEQLSLNEYLNY